MLDEDVAELSAEHDELAETLRPFGRAVDLRVLRQDPEREALGVAARSVDECDGLVDEDLRLVADLFAVRFALQRVTQLEEPVRDALQLLAALLVAEGETEGLVREASGLVDEFLRAAEGHALLDLHAELVEVDHRQRRRDERLLAELDGLREVDLFLGGEERDLPDLLEVHADRVVDADEVGGEDRRDAVLALRFLGLLFLFLDLVPRRPAVGFEDLDVVVVEGDEELFDLTGFGVREPAGDVLLGEIALLLPTRNETLGLLAVLGMDPDALRGRGLRGFLLFCRCLGHLYSCSVLRRTVDRWSERWTSSRSRAKRLTSSSSPPTSPSARANVPRTSSRRRRKFPSRSRSATI